MTLQNDHLTVTVAAVTPAAEGVIVLDLEAPGGGALPPFTAGSHLEIHLANGLIRHYSLCNDPAERQRYRIGVGLAAESRGGSRFIHETIRPGATLKISAPRNNFPLEESAPSFCFIAGGIGITPIMAMIRRAKALGKPWQLHYSARNRQRAAFLDELQALGPADCHFHFDDEAQGRVIDLDTVLRPVGAATHVYCCGPVAMMNAVEEKTKSRLPETVHFEWFTPRGEAKGTGGEREFKVILRRSGKEFTVPPGETILEVLESHGIETAYSCREGVCATCETQVLAGIPDHRDSVLTAKERAANKSVMICISRALSDTLELDL